MPEANELVVGIMAVIAQAERKMISTRTKAALAEARMRVAVTGQRMHPDVKRLGCPTGAAHLQGHGFDELAVQAVKANASGGSGIDDRRLEGRRDHVRQRPSRRRSMPGLCDASGRPVDGQVRSQRHGSASRSIEPRK